MLKSSMYLRFSELGLGMAGLSKAPLKMMMNSRIPKKAPWGEDPGKSFLDEDSPLYLMYMDLSVRYEMRISKSHPGTCMSARSSITN